MDFNFKEIDIEGFLSDEFNEPFDMRETFGIIYIGHVAFEFFKSCENDRFIEVSVLLTEEEAKNKTFGEVEYVDTINNINMVSIIDTIIFNDEDLFDDNEELLDNYLENINFELNQFIRNFSKYDISYKLDEETLYFYDIAN